MTNRKLFPEVIEEKFEIFDWRNAGAILTHVCSQEFGEIVGVLSAFELRRSDVATGGGNKSPVAKGIDQALYQLGWIEKKFDTRIIVDGVASESPTHSVDCFKGKVALEVEWNNKDPFFDRDLNNFRLLYDLRVIDVGVVITRATSLETVLKNVGRSATTYGRATTHTGKLYPKIKGGGAGGCPVLVLGITAGAFRDDL
ncbi:MAG: BglII/BstYI family type II restriction endonuclease [Beijerinckiaceae bacterium]